MPIKTVSRIGDGALDADEWVDATGLGDAEWDDAGAGDAELCNASETTWEWFIRWSKATGVGKAKIDDENRSIEGDAEVVLNGNYVHGKQH